MIKERHYKFMGAQKYFHPSDAQGVLAVENATNLRRTHCGEASRPFGGGRISTLCLEVDEPLAAVMADWSWEPTPASSSQQGSPLQTSPLQSSSSQSTHEAMQRPSHDSMPPPHDTPGRSLRPNSSRTSLVETLQTCLTSLPHGSSELTSPVSRSQSDPTGAPPAPLRQSRSSGALSASTSAKPTKRRSRASRRVPTTVLEASCVDFRDMVQRLTGIPIAAPPSQAPVRPQPQRVAPTYIPRPDRPLLSASVIRPANQSTPPSAHPTFDDLRNTLRSNSNVIRRELEVGTSVHTPFSMAGSIVTTRALSGSWEPAPLDQIGLPNGSSSESLVNESIGDSGPVSGSSSVGLMGLQEGIDDLFESQFDAWLSGEDTH